VQLRAPLVLLAAFGLQACVNLPDSVREELRCAPPDNFANRDCQAVRDPAEIRSNWRGAPAREGQIIVIEQDDALSFLLTLMAEVYQPYIHAGLVVVDEGRPYVYEAWAIYKPRWQGRPTRDPGGGVRRVTLSSFLRRAGIIAIHDPPDGVNVADVVGFARASLAARIPFDEFFDSRDSRALYCAEFVARALEAGGARPYDGVALSTNPSVRKLLDWFEVRTPRVVMAGTLLRGTQRRLLLDRSRDALAIEDHFARRRELHGRFTRDQRLGNLFRWNGLTLKFRPQVARWLTPAAPARRNAALSLRAAGGPCAHRPGRGNPSSLPGAPLPDMC
jgi:hypothetical protein